MTEHAVHIAVLEDGERPEPEDWHVAAWDTDSGDTVAVLLVGPGGVVTPAPGAYRVWVKITALPEIPVIKSPRFTIT